MSEKNYRYEGDNPEQESGDIEVADLRHTRELVEPEPEPAPEPAPAPVAEQPAPAAQPAVPEPVEHEHAEIESEIGRPEDDAEHAGHDHALHDDGEEDPAAAFEMEQLRVLFGSGLTAYLRSQLGLLFNFALISLGRMPNPATGIVAPDLDRARVAIDVFEFIVSRVQAEMQAAERTEVLQLVAELKYTFMQLAQAAAPKAPEPQS